MYLNSLNPPNQAEEQVEHQAEVNQLVPGTILTKHHWNQRQPEKGGEEDVPPGKLGGRPLEKFGAQARIENIFQMMIKQIYREIQNLVVVFPPPTSSLSWF